MHILVKINIELGFKTFSRDQGLMLGFPNIIKVAGIAIDITTISLTPYIMTVHKNPSPGFARMIKNAEKKCFCYCYR